MSLPAFERFVVWLRSVRDARELPQDDARARRVFAQLRFSDGLTCPGCGSPRGRWTPRDEWRCQLCHRRTSVTAGTQMDRTHLPLDLWLKGFWHIATSENGISALRFQRMYRMPSYGPVLRMLRTIRACFAGSSLRGDIKADAPPSTAVAQIGGRHRRRRPELASFVALALGERTLHHASASTPAAALRDVDRVAVDVIAPSTARALIESLRTQVNGTHHGVSARWLWTYAAAFFGRWAGTCAPVDAIARLLSPRPQYPWEHSGHVDGPLL